jgi:iron(III) transport system substrate-binding protein
VLILPDVKDPKVWRKNLYFIDKDRMVKPLRCSYTRFVLRNTNLVKEDEIKSYQDLLDPKWKGKMVMYDPTGPGSGSAFVATLYGLWGEEKTVEYLEQFVKQEPLLTKDYRLPVEWVARGKYPLGIGMRAEVLPDFLKLGAPVSVQQVEEGSLLAPGAGIVAIVNKRPHPNATAVFINWLLSREGLTAFSKGDGYGSARVDVPTDWVNPVFLEIPGEKVVVEDEADYKKHRSYMKRSKKIFAPLLK